jgi:hypothetical protein
MRPILIIPLVTIINNRICQTPLQLSFTVVFGDILSSYSSCLDDSIYLFKISSILAHESVIGDENDN